MFQYFSMSLNKVYFEINNITEEEYLKQLEDMPTTNEKQHFYKQVLLEFYKSGLIIVVLALTLIVLLTLNLKNVLNNYVLNLVLMKMKNLNRVIIEQFIIVFSVCILNQKLNKH